MLFRIKGSFLLLFFVRKTGLSSMIRSTIDGIDLSSKMYIISLIKFFAIFIFLIFSNCPCSDGISSIRFFLILISSRFLFKKSSSREVIKLLAILIVLSFCKSSKFSITFILFECKSRISNSFKQLRFFIFSILFFPNINTLNLLTSSKFSISFIRFEYKFK